MLCRLDGVEKTLLKVFFCKGKKCISYHREDSRILFITPVSSDEESFLDDEVKRIGEGMNIPFTLVSFHIEDWNDELSPWKAPAVFGKEEFGDGARRTLDFIENDLIPYFKADTDLGEDIPVILGGYSLAGLFSLWSMYESDSFYGVMAASPSVWFDGWTEYARSHRPNAKTVYLSLGKSEEKTRNKVMARVGDNIRTQYELLKSAGIDCTIEWNEGGHFSDPAGRCAKGFLFTAKNC